MAPFAVQAETWNVYGWQNHSWEFVDEENNEGDRSYDRMNSNAGNIGFSASVDTGIDGITVNAQCEQFTFYNQFADSTASTWCNRNSKIGLAHPMAGEFMMATWLLPYNEGVAQWVDPFYDAGADSHTNIMGSVGAATSSTFYNPVFGRTNGFNRRQDNILQYWSPNWNGFVFRFAWTLGYRDETKAPIGGGEIDPVIRSSSLAYTNGPVWLAVTWQDHEDWTAASVGEMNSSDAESFRVAGRYIMDMGDGVSVQISAMWEDLEYEFNGVSSVDTAMNAFGFGNWANSGNLMISDPALRAQKTLGVFKDLFLQETDTAGTYAYKAGSVFSDAYDPDGDGTANPVAVTAPTDLSNSSATILTSITPPSAAVEDNPLTAADDTKAEGATEAGNLGANVDGTDDAAKLLKAHVMALQTAAGADGAHADTKAQYDLLVNTATANARAAQGGNVKIERDAWMVSGKIKFGGPVDFRFSYADADDLEVSCGACSGDWNESGGDAWNVGIFYTMPAGTELRLTYSEVNSDDNVGYGQSIPGTGVGSPGSEIEMFAIGIVHWFD